MFCDRRYRKQSFKFSCLEGSQALCSQTKNYSVLCMICRNNIFLRLELVVWWDVLRSEKSMWSIELKFHLLRLVLCTKASRISSFCFSASVRLINLFFQFGCSHTRVSSRASRLSCRRTSRTSVNLGLSKHFGQPHFYCRCCRFLELDLLIAYLIVDLWRISSLSRRHFVQFFEHVERDS